MEFCRRSTALPRGSPYGNPAPAFAAPSLCKANRDSATELFHSPFIALSGHEKLQEAEVVALKASIRDKPQLPVLFCSKIDVFLPALIKS